MKVKNFFLIFALAPLSVLQAGAQSSILTKTYYLNEFNGTTVGDGNGAWSSNSAMPGSVSQAGGSLIVDLANTAETGVTLPVTISSISGRGEEYTLEADLPVGANYVLAIAKDDYYFDRTKPEKHGSTLTKNIKRRYTCKPIIYIS